MFLKIKYFLYVAISLQILIGCVSKKSVSKDKKKNVKNVILLIGDGMGLSQISTSFYFNDKVSNFSRFKNIGLIKTSSASHLITDSAAGATAFSTGKKTYNGAIAMSTDTLQSQNIVELLTKRKMKTGVIATSSITHATPASFFAHVKSRELPEEIASWLPKSDLDYFAAGGLQFFNNRKDSVNYLEKLKDSNFNIFTDVESLKTNLSSDKKYGFLLAENGMQKISDGRGNFLTNATKQSLEHLSKNNNGFFLMIEGSQIDWGGHDNDANYIINEVKDFDKTIGEVLTFAEKNGETLVIVTADHETGGFTLASSQKQIDGKLISNYNKIDPQFSTNGHSATLIPVFAYGPNSNNFKGIYENTEIFHKIVNALKN